jgi:hypothetical protein
MRASLVISTHNHKYPRWNIARKTIGNSSMKLQATYELMPPQVRDRTPTTYRPQSLRKLTQRRARLCQADIDGCPQAPLPQGHLTEEGQPQMGQQTPRARQKNWFHFK